MQKLKLLIALLAIVTLTNFVNAGDSINIGGKGFQVKMVPTDKNAISPGPVAEADCDVHVNKSDVILHWATRPFTHTTYPELTSDAVLAATVTQQTGKVAVSPSRIVDRTNISDRDNTAAIAMGIQGSGKLKIKLEVGIDNERAAGGKHSTTVVLTVTGQ